MGTGRRSGEQRPAGPAESGSRSSPRRDSGTGSPASLLRLQRTAGNRAVARAVARAAGAADPTTVQRKMSKGKKWTAVPGSSIVPRFVAYSQDQIDAMFSKLASTHAELDSEIKSARKLVGQISQGATMASAINEAEAVWRIWDKPVDWDDRDIALTALSGAREKVKQAVSDVGGQRDVETKDAVKQLGSDAADRLLKGGKAYTVGQVHQLISRLGAKELVKLLDGVTFNEFKKLTDTVDDATLRALADLKGRTVADLFDTVADLDAFAKGAKAADVGDVVAVLTPAEIEKLSVSLTAKMVKDKLLTPLGATAVKNLVAQLTAEQVSQLRNTLDPALIKPVAEANFWIKDLHTERERVKKLTVGPGAVPPADFATVWMELRPPLLRKLWDKKPDADVIKALKKVGPAALKSMLTDLTQAEVFDYLARLGHTGTKGVAEAMAGKDVKATAPSGSAATLDQLLKTLGKDHAAEMKAAASHFGSGSTMATVLKGCHGGGLDAAKTATFLEDARTEKWKKEAPLKEFFTKAGAAVERLVTLAKQFSADGNDGKKPDAPGEGPPADAVHSRVVDGATYTVAAGDVAHYMAGHTYAAFAMTDKNASRGDSSMFPTGTDQAGVEAVAATVLDHAQFRGLVSAALAAAEKYAERTIAGYRVGVNASLRRVTKLFPTGNTKRQADMEAVAKLFQSRS